MHEVFECVRADRRRKVCKTAWNDGDTESPFPFTKNERRNALLAINKWGASLNGTSKNLQHDRDIGQGANERSTYRDMGGGKGHRRQKRKRSGLITSDPDRASPRMQRQGYRAEGVGPALTWRGDFVRELTNHAIGRRVRVRGKAI